MHQQGGSIRREVLIALCTLVLSVVLLPAMIYVVGVRVFGSYGGSGGLTGLYLATLGDLAVPRLAAWTLATGPTLCVVLLRLLFHFTRTAATPAVTPPLRREPRIDN